HQLYPKDQSKTPNFVIFSSLAGFSYSNDNSVVANPPPDYGVRANSRCLSHPFLNYLGRDGVAIGWSGRVSCSIGSDARRSGQRSGENVEPWGPRLCPAASRLDGLADRLSFILAAA